MYQIWRIYLDLWGHDCKKWVWPTFRCKLGQSDPIVMQFKLDMSCHLLNVYTKFQIDISKHVEEKSGKHGRTDGHCHGIISPFFKWANKNTEWRLLGQLTIRIWGKINSKSVNIDVAGPYLIDVEEILWASEKWHGKTDRLFDQECNSYKQTGRTVLMYVGVKFICKNSSLCR